MNYIDKHADLIDAGVTVDTLDRAVALRKLLRSGIIINEKLPHDGASMHLVRTKTGSRKTRTHNITVFCNYKGYGGTSQMASFINFENSNSRYWIVEFEEPNGAVEWLQKELDPERVLEKFK